MKFWDSDISSFQVNSSRRYISVEIEVAEADQDNDINDAASGWSASIVEDGSLPDTGFEINTSPANGQQFLDQIRDLCDALDNQNAVIDTTCGLHAHADARDFSYYDLRRLIKLYAKIEPALLSLVPGARRNGKYCKPCGKLYLAAVERSTYPEVSRKSILAAIYDGTDTKNLKHSKYHDSRYRSLNLHSWIFRKTVECRIMSGSVDAETIQNWGMLWAVIVDTAYRLSESQIDQLTVKRQGMTVLLLIAKSVRLRSWIRNRHESFKDT